MGYCITNILGHEYSILMTCFTFGHLYYTQLAIPAAQTPTGQWRCQILEHGTRLSDFYHGISQQKLNRKLPR